MGKFVNPDALNASNGAGTSDVNSVDRLPRTKFVRIVFDKLAKALFFKDETDIANTKAACVEAIVDVLKRRNPDIDVWTVESRRGAADFFRAEKARLKKEGKGFVPAYVIATAASGHEGHPTSVMAVGVLGGKRYPLRKLLVDEASKNGSSLAELSGGRDNISDKIYDRIPFHYLI